MSGGSTIILRKQDARYLRDLENVPLENIKSAGRTVRDLNALLRISKAVNSVRGLEALEKQMLESIFEVAPADRAAILLCRERHRRMDLGVRVGSPGRSESGRAGEPDHRGASAFGRRGHAL